MIFRDGLKKSITLQNYVYTVLPSKAELRENVGSMRHYDAACVIMTQHVSLWRSMCHYDGACVIMTQTI